MTKPIDLLLFGRMTAPWVDWMTAQLADGWNVVHWSEDDAPEALQELAPKAEVIVGGRFDSDIFPAVPNLKLWQIPFTGFDWLDPAAFPKGCRVSNTFEHEIAIAEWVLAAMLEMEIGIAAISARFKEKRWENRAPGIGDGRVELFGKTLGIVGYGHIGREAARRARAFGMRIEAASRRPPDEDAPQPDAFTTMEGLDAMLGRSDYVLLTLPLADETEGLFDAGRFRAMKSDGVFINVGRGRVADEQALYEALRDKVIGGAVIDVWYQYPKPDDPDPTPSKFPFEALDNVVMTPHMSAKTGPMRQRRWQFVADNLQRYARGEALENVCLEI